METWIILAVLFFFAWALLDIRERLPRSKMHSELSYVPPAKEGFQMRCQELRDGEFSVGFDGEWNIGRYFDVIGEVSPYHEDYQAEQKLKFNDQQSVRIHPTTERYQKSRIGNVFVSKSGKIDVHVFLPFEVHQQLRTELRETIDQVLEIDIGENRKASKDKPTTYGVYRLQLRNYF